MYEEVYAAVKKAGVFLPKEVKSLIQHAGDDSASENNKQGNLVLSMIRKNIEQAESSGLPLCQDTGMVILFADIGAEREDLPQLLPSLESTLCEAVKQAYRDGYFRMSVVDEPVFSRKNTGTNLPPVIHYSLVPGSSIRISGMLKGFGSENCSYLYMLNPTAGADGVVQAVRDAVSQAGGKPCPPVVLGIGIGGTSEKALLLSKRALLRDIGSRNPDDRYAELELQIADAVNQLGIGPGGLGGPLTAMDAFIEQVPTHIAGMPVGISISCWADRKFTVEIS